MKKTLSLLLSIVMLLSIASGVNMSAYAAGWLSYVESIQLNTTYNVSASTSDYTTGSDHGFMGDDFYDAYQFTIPMSGKTQLYIESESMYYLSHTSYYIYKVDNLDSYIACYHDNKYYSSARDVYYYTYDLNLNAGTYYLLASYQGNIVWNGSFGSDDCSLTIKYSPSIAKPSSLKISSRGVYSLKLSWGKVGNVTGYQVQRKVGDKFKHIAYTSKNYYTVKDLAAATNYALRVRAYKTIDGKKYFSSYRYLTTPTKPSKVSIKTPTTNSKHQITVKWKAMARGSGYKVQFSRKKDFSTVVATRLVSGKTKTSYTGKNLTKGKKYYVRVRGYKTVDGKNYYGAWSDVKSIKCK